MHQNPDAVRLVMPRNRSPDRRRSGERGSRLKAACSSPFLKQSKGKITPQSAGRNQKSAIRNPKSAIGNSLAIISLNLLS
jgi:hypothetical protein